MIEMNERKKSNNPRPVGIQALSDLALEAWVDGRDAMRAKLEAVLETKRKALSQACVQAARSTAQGHSLLKLYPRARARLDTEYCEKTERNFIVIQLTGQGYKFNIKCTPAMLKKLQVLSTAVDRVQKEARQYWGYATQPRRKFVVDAVKLDDKAMAQIRTIVERAVRRAHRTP